MKEYLLRLFNYNHWATEILLDVIDKNNIHDEYILKMMSHIINVQMIRLPMITGKKAPEGTMWDLHSASKLRELNDDVITNTINYLTRMKGRDFLDKIAGKTLEGEDFLISKGDMMIHLANHASHHRGQVAMRMRELGFTPPNIGYLQYSISFPDFW